MIYIDDRIGSKELYPHIQGERELTHLEYADFSFIGEGEGGRPVSVGIERKTLGDLATSITTGRLSGHQLIGLLNCYDYIYILIEGSFKVNKQGIMTIFRGRRTIPLTAGSRIMTARFINKYLNTLSVMFGVIPSYTNGKRETGAWIADMYAWWQKPWDKHRSHLQFHIAPPIRSAAMLVRPSVLHRMLKEIDGLGWDKAKRISEEFENLLDCATADAVQLEEIEGIGPKLAKRVIETLRGEI